MTAIPTKHPGTTLWTIGHSTRSVDEFVTLLKSQGIATLADVRRFPGSRKYPQFNQGSLIKSLKDEGLDYLWFPDLGGRRRPIPSSTNTAWRNEAFRAYADYMQTDPFRLAIERLLVSARAKPTAIMCAESVWWRCHRGLISDYLKAEGFEVIHIVGAKKTEEHPFTSAATIVDGKLSYSGRPLFH
jgi:uncharacterized protein (DUF488 family)